MPDFKIQRGTTTISGGQSVSPTLVAGTDYDAPSALTSAFIRIVSAGNCSCGYESSFGRPEDSIARVTNASNMMTSFTFDRQTGDVDPLTVFWELIEYTGAPGGPNEFVVRDHGIATMLGSALTASLPAITSIVDDNDVVPFITGLVDLTSLLSEIMV